MNSVAFEDRRMFVRHEVNLPMQYLNGSADIKGYAQSVNISANGIGLISPKGLPVSTRLDMWLVLPHALDPFYTQGKVAWVRWVWFGKYRMGINLVKVDLMGIAYALKNFSPSSYSEPAYPRLGRWERFRLWTIYYRSVFLKTFSPRKAA